MSLAVHVLLDISFTVGGLFDRSWVFSAACCLLISLNGVPSCANKRLLVDILRAEWQFRGYVVSDDDALEHLVNDHHYVSTYVQAAVAAIKAGCNLELTGDNSGWVFTYLAQVLTDIMSFSPVQCDIVFLVYYYYRRAVYKAFKMSMLLTV